MKTFASALTLAFAVNASNKVAFTDVEIKEKTVTKMIGQGYYDWELSAAGFTLEAYLSLAVKHADKNNTWREGD